MLKRIKIEMSWVEYINARHGKDANISENEEKKAVEEIEEKATKESFFINRMFFLFYACQKVFLFKLMPIIFCKC